MILKTTQVPFLLNFSEAKTPPPPIQSLLLDKNTSDGARQQSWCDKPNQTSKLFPQKDKVNKIYLAPHPFKRTSSQECFISPLQTSSWSGNNVSTIKIEIWSGCSGIPHLQAGLQLHSPMPPKPELEHFVRDRAIVQIPDYHRPSSFCNQSVLATEHAPI